MTSAQLKKELTEKLPATGVVLQDWLDRVPAELTSSVEGIYCGRDGRIHESVAGTNLWLTIGWYNKKVEYAYLSYSRQ